VKKEELHASLSDPVLDTMNFLNEVTSRYPDAISFAPGRPYHGLSNVNEMSDRIGRYLAHLDERGHSPQQVRDALYQYGPTAGQIRELIAGSLLVDEDIDVSPEAVVVTVGSQEAMLLVLRALMADRDDVLIVSTPCYLGIVGAARLLDVAVTAVPEGDDGPCVAELETAILAERARGRRPRAIYLVPDHANPSGATMPLDARRALLDMAERTDVLIVEDSPYRLLGPEPPPPTLKALDRACRVIHLGSYSKTLLPGIRVGFAVADQEVVDGTGRTGLLAHELAKIKSMVTVNTSSLSQAVVAGSLLASAGRVSQIGAELAGHYAGALRATLVELDRRLPAERRAALGVAWNSPRGGFFLALTVAFRADEAALTRSAKRFGVIWTPMAYFHPEGGGDRGIRLSISHLTPADITEGVARLGRFIEAETVRR
jgi:(S)-3,5-dihydroxyphenylglycine transaminase